MFFDNYLIFTPITRADGAFPRVFVAEDYSYEGSTTIETKIAALKDLERAFQLLNTGIYAAPENYAAGLRKIVELVGEPLSSDGANASSLRRCLEREAFPDRKGHVGKFIETMSNVFRRKARQQEITHSENSEGNRVIGGKPDPHGYAKFRMRYPDLGP